MQKMHITAMGKPLGRPPKVSETNSIGAEDERNEIESTFGIVRRIYRATISEPNYLIPLIAGLALCYFVKNVFEILIS